MPKPGTALVLVAGITYSSSRRIRNSEHVNPNMKTKINEQISDVVDRELAELQQVSSEDKEEDSDHAGESKNEKYDTNHKIAKNNGIKYLLSFFIFS